MKITSEQKGGMVAENKFPYHSISIVMWIFCLILSDSILLNQPIFLETRSSLEG